MSDLSRPPVCSLPTWKQALRFRLDPMALIDECQAALGEVFCLRLPGPEHWTFITSPRVVRQLYRQPPGRVSAGEIHARFLGSLFGTDATFCLDGAAHRARQRALLPLLSQAAQDPGIEVMVEMTTRRLARWRGRTLRMLDACHRLSLDFLLRILFGHRRGDAIEALGDSFERLSTLGARSTLVALPKLQWNLGRFSPWGRIVHQRERTRGQMRALIESAREQPEDFDGTLLIALLDHPQHAALFTGDDALIDELMNLLFAGHETTGAALAWCLEVLAADERIREHLRDELDRVVGDADLDADHLGQLHYLDAVIQETFRAKPIGPFSSFRRVEEPIELEAATGRYRLPAGDVVAYSFSAMSQRPDLFECPHAVRPERFLGGHSTSQEWAPFGGGGRVCLGKAMALMELQVALATFMRHADFALVHSETRIERSGHLLAPAEGLPMRVGPAAH
ncbi:MAG: cytochrome P450 [Acidobacteriota bacterium]